MSHTADRHPSHDPYLGHLPPDRAILLAAQSGVDLSPEIRLLRTFLSSLAEDLSSNHHDVARVLGVLVRAVSLQTRRRAEETNTTSSIEEAAEDVLRAAGNA